MEECDRLRSEVPVSIHIEAVGRLGMTYGAVADDAHRPTTNGAAPDILFPEIAHHPFMADPI